MTAFLVMAGKATAGPLGYIPRIHEQELMLTFDFRSDLWTTPLSYKDSPIRIVGGDLRIPIFHSKTWAASASIYEESLNLGRADFQLGNENVFIANSLRNEHIGGGIRKSFAGESSLSAFAAYVTASDNPWSGPRNNYFYGSVIYLSEFTDNHQWIFAVDQTNNRGLYNGKPFPYIGVTIRTGNAHDVVYSFGFPFFTVDWVAREDWKSHFQITPYGLNLETAKNVGSGMTAGISLAYTLRSYLLDERVEEKDRLYYQEVKAETYISKAISSATRVLFAFGGSVERKLYETQELYEPNAKTEVFENDLYGRLAVEFKL